MLPLQKIDEEWMGDGRALTLRKRGDHFFITIDGEELMSSQASHSEQTLARSASAELGEVSAPRVLIGGLGMGYTVRAALDCFPGDAIITVAEVFSRVVDWNHRFLGHLTGYPLRDRRVTVRRGDVVPLLRDDSYDVILLDVDNGPRALTLKSNEALYTLDGVCRLHRALHGGGVLAVWSAAADPEFLMRMHKTGFTARSNRVSAYGDQGAQHVVFLGKR